MTDTNDIVNSRIHLIRLIPDTTPKHPRSEKREAQVRRMQKESVAMRLVQSLKDEHVALVCEDKEQCSILCPNYNKENDLDLFLSGKVRCIAMERMPDDDFNPKQTTNVIFVGNHFRQSQLADCLANLLITANVSVILMFHAFSNEDWAIGNVIADFNPNLISLNNVTVKDDSEEDKPISDDEFDRVKVYILPYANASAEYKFMWNDGFNGIFHIIKQNNEVIKEGYIYSSDLLTLLNKEFGKQIPTKKLATLIDEKFNSDGDFEVFSK